MTKTCVICKLQIPTSDAKRCRGGTSYLQWCPRCGNFEIPAVAVRLLEDAVQKRNRTRQEVIDHFAEYIQSENAAGRVAGITIDAAQSFGFELV